MRNISTVSLWRVAATESALSSTASPTPSAAPQQPTGRSIFEDEPAGIWSVNPAPAIRSSRPCGRMWLGRDVKPVKVDPIQRTFKQIGFPADFDPFRAVAILKAYEDLRVISGSTSPLYLIPHNDLKNLVRKLSFETHPEGKNPDSAIFIRIRQAWNLIDDFKNPPL